MVWLRVAAFLISIAALSQGCGRSPTEPSSAAEPPQASQPPSPGTPTPTPSNAFEVTGTVTDERGAPLAAAAVTMGLWSAGFPHWPSGLTDGSGSYRITFEASPRGDGFVARAQVVADGYEEYWRNLVMSTGTTTFVENFRLSRLVRIDAGDSIVLPVRPDAGICRGWVGEVCPIVHVTVPRDGELAIEVTPSDASAARPPVEVCCIDGDERYGNPITVLVAAGVELEVKVGMRGGFTTVQSFVVKTAFETF